MFCNLKWHRILMTSVKIFESNLTFFFLFYSYSLSLYLSLYPAIYLRTRILWNMKFWSSFHKLSFCFVLLKVMSVSNSVNAFSTIDLCMKRIPLLSANHLIKKMRTLFLKWVPTTTISYCFHSTFQEKKKKEKKLNTEAILLQ